MAMVMVFSSLSLLGFFTTLAQSQVWTNQMWCGNSNSASGGVQIFKFPVQSSPSLGTMQTVCVSECKGWLQGQQASNGCCATETFDPSCWASTGQPMPFWSNTLYATTVDSTMATTSTTTRATTTTTRATTTTTQTHPPHPFHPTTSSTTSNVITVVQTIVQNSSTTSATTSKVSALLKIDTGSGRASCHFNAIFGTDMRCGMQWLIVGGLTFLFAMWLICAFYCAFHLREDKRNVFDVENYGEVQYAVKVPPPVRSSSFTSSVGAGETEHTIDGKTHVVWDVDDRNADEYFRRVSKERPPEEPLPQPAEANKKTSLLLLPKQNEVGGEQNEDELEYEVILEQGFSNSKRPRQGSNVAESDAASLGVVTAKSHGLKLMYNDGDQIEYFTETYKMWVPATVHPVVQQVMKSTFEFNTTVMYDVHLQGVNAQEKQDVKLHNLRKPFEAAELLEVFSLRDEGQWLPAIVNGPQTPCATWSGYQIVLATDGKVLELIPPLRLRRRFPAGLPVSVYAGSAHGGWRDAEVRSDPYEGSNNTARATEDGSKGEPVANLQAGVAIFWTTVPVKMLDTSEDDGPIFRDVPSYLVRNRNPEADVRGWVVM